MKYQYFCQFCTAKDFEKKSELIHHFDEVHGSHSQVECLQCKCDIPGGLRDFMEHVSTTHQGFTMKESLGKLKLNRSILKMKKKKIKRSMSADRIFITSSLVRCTRCEQKIPSSIYKDHLMQCRSKKRRRKNSHDTCRVCNKVVASVRLKQHLMSVHSVGETIQCEYCPEKFFKKYHQQIHMKRVHSINIIKKEKKLSCVICLKRFINNYTLRQHINAVHEDKRDHLCDICGAGFKMASVLRVHKRSHSGLRPYKCKICGKAFIRVTECKMHLRKFHNIECNVRFNDPLAGNTLPIEVISSNL